MGLDVGPRPRRPCQSALTPISAVVRARDDRRRQAGGIHPDLIEVYHIIEGAGTVVTGGTLVKQEGAPADTRPIIQGGKAQRVTVAASPEGGDDRMLDLEPGEWHCQVELDRPS